MENYNKILRQLEFGGISFRENPMNSDYLKLFKDSSKVLDFNEVVYSFISGEIASKKHIIFALNEKITFYYYNELLSKKDIPFSNIQNILIQKIESVDIYEMTIYLYEGKNIVIVNENISNFIHFKKFIENEIFKIQRDSTYDNLIKKNIKVSQKVKSNLDRNNEFDSISLANTQKQKNFYDYFINLKHITFVNKTVFAILMLNIISVIFTAFNTLDLLINGELISGNYNAKYFVLFKVDVIVFILNLITSTAILTLNLFFFLWMSTKKNVVVRSLFLTTTVLSFLILILWITVLIILFSANVQWDELITSNEGVNNDSNLWNLVWFGSSAEDYSSIIARIDALLPIFIIGFIILVLAILSLSTVVIIFIGLIDKKNNSYSKIEKEKTNDRNK